MAGRKFNKCHLSEDGSVKFDFMTSLQNIVMAKIINHFWMNKNSLQDIVNFIHSVIKVERRKSSHSWRKIKNKIIAKVSELPLPKSTIADLNKIVPVLGNSILNWIRYHECILNTSEYSAVDQISNITWTTRGKIDYAQTAKNILADKDTCLCDDYKYKLACMYCLEDEIAVLAPNVVNEHYLDSVQIHMHPMVYFWTAHITGDNTKLNNHYRSHILLRNISINGYMIQLLINSNKSSYGTFNEVPIRYMWGQLSEKEKAKNITSLVKELSNQELRYTLLSRLDFEEHQREIFKDCSDTILFGMLNDWLWREYFMPTAVQILDIMKPSAYLSILKYICEVMIKNCQEENKFIYNEYSYIFKQLWQESSASLKDFIVKHENGYFIERIVFSIPWERNMDIIGLILSALNTYQKKRIILEYRGRELCAKMIKNGRWDLLQLFIKYTLSSEDVNQLKERMIECNWNGIAAHLLEEVALDKLDQFMSWVFGFKSEEETTHFRLKFAHTRIFDLALKSIIDKTNGDFTKLETLLKWCANGDIRLINQFKGKILYSFPELIKKLLKEELYELTDQILNWCFSNNQIKVMQFKCNMYKDPCFVYFVDWITSFLIERDNSFKLLDKFIDWSFTKEQEVHEFKTWILNPSKECCCSSCSLFLLEGQFELADKIIEWCGVKSDEDIAKFKHMLMLSDDINRIFRNYFSIKNPDLSLLIKWFNPSEELVEAFKKIFPQEKCPNSFHELLDDFLQSIRKESNSNSENSLRELNVNSSLENYRKEDSL